MKNLMLDIYADVIDNYGDMAFAINLIEKIHADTDTLIRLFSNDRILFKTFSQNFSKPELVTYQELSDIESFSPAKIIINLFDKKLNYSFYEKYDFPIEIVSISYFLLHEQSNDLKPSVASLHNTLIYTSKNLNIRYCIVSLLKETG